MSRYTCPLDCKVYVGGLTRSASREEVERAFAHYGKLRNVFVARNPPGFAFVEFENPDDAEDSVRGLDGRLICGVRVRVELSHGKSRHKGGPGFRQGRDDYRGGGGGGRRRSRTPDKRNSRYSNSRSSNSRSRSRGRDQHNSNGSSLRENTRYERDDRRANNYRDTNSKDNSSIRERDTRETKRRVNRSRSRS